MVKDQEDSGHRLQQHEQEVIKLQQEQQESREQMVELLQKFGKEVRKVEEMRMQMGEPCSYTPVKNETDRMEVTVSNRQPLL